MVLPLLHWKTSTARGARGLSPALTARLMAESRAAGTLRPASTGPCFQGAYDPIGHLGRAWAPEPGEAGGSTSRCPMTAGRSQTPPGLPGVLDCDKRMCDDANVSISYVCDEPGGEPAAKTHAWVSLTNSPKAFKSPPTSRLSSGLQV